MKRREALKLGAGAAAAIAVVGFTGKVSASATHRLCLASLDVELARGVVVRTIAFNGTVPGPLLDVDGPARAGKGPTLLEVRNDTGVDCGVSLGTTGPRLIVPAGTLIGTPYVSRERGLDHYRGDRLVDSSPGGSGFGMMGRRCTTPGDHEQEHMLSIHHWLPSLIRRGGLPGDAITYRHISFNDKLLAASEPIKVRTGQRVRFHFVNAGATRPVTLSLPEHRFNVVALDGYPVPQPRQVDRIFLGAGESVEATVDMNRPGRWILGSVNRDDRAAGLGRLIEYAGMSGPAIQSPYAPPDWDYGSFGVGGADVPARSLTLMMRATAGRIDGERAGFEIETAPFTSATLVEVRPGERYRFTVANFTRERHVFQVVNHRLELIGEGRGPARILKDVICLPTFAKVAVEFVARGAEVAIAHSPRVTLDRDSTAPAS